MWQVSGCGRLPMLLCTQSVLQIILDIMSLYTMQVKRHFSRCQIVGSRFPIALVHWGGTVLEVSSFGTRAKRDTIPTDAAALLSWPPSQSKASPCPYGLHFLCPRLLIVAPQSWLQHNCCCQEE